MLTVGVKQNPQKKKKITRYPYKLPTAVTHDTVKSYLQ